MSDGPYTMQKRFTIGSDGKSDAQDVQGYTLTAVRTPSAITATAITFEGDIDGEGTFSVLTSTAAGTVTVTWPASGAYGANEIMLPVGGDALVSGLIKLKIIAAAGDEGRVFVGHFLRTNR